MAATITFADLTARYQLESNTVDDIGGNDGVGSGGLVYDTSTPILGVASLDPDGFDDKVVIPDGAGHKPGAGNFGFSFLLDLQTTDIGRLPLDYQRQSGVFQGYFILIASSGRVQFFVRDIAAVTKTVTGTTDIRGGPALITCAFDKGVSDGMRLYINDTEEGTRQDVSGFGDVGHSGTLRLCTDRTETVFTRSPTDEVSFYMGYVPIADDAVFLYNGGSFRSLAPSGISTLPRRGIGRGILRGVGRGL